VDRWMDHMRRGEFEAAWAVSDAVLRARAGVPCWHLPRHLQYVWDGRPLAGRRVLVRCYHGLGDTIQFIRYMPRLKALAAAVTVWAQPPLLPLLGTMDGIDRLLPLHDGTPDAAYDVDVELMELPHVFRTTLATVPAEVPYLRVEPVPLPCGGRLAVGLAWRAGEWDARRSIPLALLAPLGKVPGIAWYILQRGPGLIEWRDGFGILPRVSNLFEEARLIRALDLVISVDTMPAHLAGALGVPVWTLLPAKADWRWMDGRDDSPWYPTMRLFRQAEDGVWEPVIMRVAAALKRLTTGGRSVLVPKFGRPQKERMLPQELPQTPQRLLP
jgi:Glycosyltransferase family 9 (heptosyltransferase)